MEKAVQCCNQCGTLEILEDYGNNKETCELQSPKIREVLDSISEVMN
jgi:hypothetical protein